MSILRKSVAPPLAAIASALTPYADTPSLQGFDVTKGSAFVGRVVAAAFNVDKDAQGKTVVTVAAFFARRANGSEIVVGGQLTVASADEARTALIADYEASIEQSAKIRTAQADAQRIRAKEAPTIFNFENGRH